MSQPWISAYRGKTPNIHSDAFVDISVRVIGAVKIEQDASIWPMAVLRADSAEVQIGRRAGVLDLALVEAPEGHPVRIEEEALVSHGATVHGATIESGALIGIGAIVLDGATVGTGSIVGSGSLITPGTLVPANSLVLGVPGKIVRETTAEERRTIWDQVEELYEKSRYLMRA
jgi:carbonic anhydrase/acetyltransferase-like protein (isoleucine patch superfamily)